MVAGIACAATVMAASGIQSPADGTKIYGLQPINISVIPGYASNRQTYCQINVYNAENILVASQEYAYSSSETVIKQPFVPQTYGKYTIELSAYTYDDYHIKINGGRIRTSTFKFIKPSDFVGTVGQFALSTNHGGKATLDFLTPGATGHEVYRATKKNGKYKKIATTNKSSYTDSGLLFKTYYYKVKPFVKGGGKTYYGKAATAKINCKAVCKLYRAVNSAGKKIKGINVFCTAEGVSGYKVYRATKKNGKFKCIINSKDPGNMDKKVKKGKKYYYKVRPYIKSKGKTKYLGYTAVKSITAKW